MKKNPLVPILGGGVIAALVLGVMAVIVLVDAGLLHLLGVRCDSFGWLVLYVLVEAVLGLPLELFTAGLTKALVKLGWASPRLANLLYIPLDALCTVFAFWVADMLMEPVEANLLAVLVVGLLSALFSRPVKQAAPLHHWQGYPHLLGSAGGGADCGAVLRGGRCAPPGRDSHTRRGVDHRGHQGGCGHRDFCLPQPL